MVKIIFLDIDGVIATPNKIEDGMWGLCDTRQELLGEILEKTNAKIVLSSSWRKPTVKETKEYMLSQGFWFSDKIIGVTIRAYHEIKFLNKIHLSIPRGVEIKQWIDTHIHSDNGKNFKRKKLNIDYNFVIIDDDTDMLFEHKNNFVNTDAYNGLTKKDVKKAIKILNNKKHIFYGFTKFFNK
jgi:hypothetical protein